MRAKAMRDISLLEEFGRSLQRPQADTVKGDRYKGLYELRSKFASNITRSKPPQRDLETARSRMKDAQERGL